VKLLLQGFIQMVKLCKGQGGGDAASAFHGWFLWIRGSKTAFGRKSLAAMPRHRHSHAHALASHLSRIKDVHPLTKIKERSSCKP
jgi:hypothetical protein